MKTFCLLFVLLTFFILLHSVEAQESFEKHYEKTITTIMESQNGYLAGNTLLDVNGEFISQNPMDLNVIKRRQIENNNYVLGWQRPLPYLDLDPQYFVIKINSFGDTLWKTKVDTKDRQGAFFLTFDFGIDRKDQIVVLYGNFYGGGGNSYERYLNVFDSTGLILYGREIKGHIFYDKINFIEDVFNIAQSFQMRDVEFENLKFIFDDNNIYVLNGVYRVGKLQIDNYVMGAKISFKKTILEDSTYKNYNTLDTPETYLIDFELKKDGNFIYCYTDLLDSMLTLKEINFDGKLIGTKKFKKLYTREYFYQNGQAYVDINNTSDGGFILLAQQNDSCHIYKFGTTYILSTQNTITSSINCSTNISAKGINFSCKEEPIKSFILQDITGKSLLRMDNIENKEIFINKEQLHEGIYFYTIETQGGKYSKRKIVL